MSLSFEQVKTHWERWANEYGTALRATTKTHTIKLLEVFALTRHLPTDARILEIGCGNGYNAHYCATRQLEPSRSGRSPACRSYYGVYDLAGNVWEWTRSPDAAHEDFFLVAGGNWEAAEKADCDLSKYSFYPQNRYPGVGFRCCAEAH